VVADVFGIGKKKFKPNFTEEPSHTPRTTGERIGEHTKILAPLESLFYIFGVRGELNKFASALF